MGNSSQKAVVILIRGLPGSGKTYIAERLRHELGGGDVVMLDPDAIDYESEDYKIHTKALTEDGVDKVLHPYRFLRAQAYQGIAEHRIVIWNQPFSNVEMFNKMTANFKLQAAEHDTEIVILVVEVQIDPLEAKRRIEGRKQVGGHGPSDQTFERFVNDYRSVKDEGYHTIQVSGNDAESAVASIKAELDKLI